MDRKSIITKNISLGLIFKFFNMSLVYITIPFLLTFLGKENYGIWITIFSIINILFFVDAGIVNGLKTKLSQSISINNYELSSNYISTAYLSVFFIAIAFFFIGLIFINTIELKRLLNVSGSVEEAFLKEVFIITLVFVVSNFIISLFKSLFYAVQKAAVIEIAMFVYQGLVLIMVVYAINHWSSSLYTVTVIYGTANLITGLVFSIVFFKNNRKLIPKRVTFRKERLKDMMGLSLGFFVIQLSMIVIFTSDNLLISNILGPKEVVNYDVTLKLFQLVVTLAVIVLEPFWSLFSDAYAKNDFAWIKHTLKKLNTYYFLAVLAVIFLLFTARSIIAIWVGDSVEIEKLLIYLMGIYILIRVYGVIYMYFLNGIGKIKLQMWLYVFGAIINIPLSIYFAKGLNMGSSGIILGTILSILALTIVLPFQSHKILDRR